MISALKIFIGFAVIFLLLSTPGQGETLQLDDKTINDSFRVPGFLTEVEPASPTILDRLQGRLEVGTRIISIDLKDDTTDIDETRNGFLGTIVGLDDQTDQLPTRFFVDVLFNRYVGIELSYDKIAAETRTSPLFGDVKSDGTLELSGPILSVFGRYPNPTGITPYGGLGVAFYSSEFEETAHWGKGYPNLASYVAAGSPDEPLNGRTRTMNVDGVTALVVYGGVLWSFHENWAVDLYIRSLDADVDANFIGGVGDAVDVDKDGVFPMGHTGYGLGIHYVF